jgi:hypothetical protein
MSWVSSMSSDYLLCLLGFLLMFTFPHTWHPQTEISLPCETVEATRPPVWSLGFSPQGRHVLIAGWSAAVHCFHVETGARTLSLPAGERIWRDAA